MFTENCGDIYSFVTGFDIGDFSNCKLFVISKLFIFFVERINYTYKLPVEAWMVPKSFLVMSFTVAWNLLCLKLWEASVNGDCSGSFHLDNFGGYK